MIKQLAHVCIGCTDLDAATRFYCDCLGFTRVFDFVKDEKTIGFYLGAGGNTYIEFFKADSVPDTASPIRHLCLETDDIDAVIAQLHKYGYHTGPKKVGGDQSWQVWVSDAPDHVKIEFHQYTDQSSQRTGKTCYVNWK
ncbi:MAG: VOC family protein [Phycisphaera sp.]|nr:VOC family protein [Phycisphaera sp.]